MKVILYIGQHKTGSTSLQTFLAQNSVRLMRHGILYPTVETQGAAHMLARTLAGKDTPGPLPINIREAHNALAFRMMNNHNPARRIPPFHTELPGLEQMVLAVRRQIKQLTPKAVILCSEVFSNFCTIDTVLIETLRDIFTGEFSNVEFQVYCALRRPDEHIAAWHSQRLKFGEKPGRLKDKATPNYLNTIHFDYRAMLAPWLDIFSDCQFTIRNYRDVLANGGLEQDFIKQSGVRFPRRLISTKRKNPSVPYALIEIARQANIQLEKEPARALRKVLLTLPAISDIPRNADVELYQADNRSLLLDSFAPIHDWLSAITNETAFFPDFASIGTENPIPEREAMLAALTSALDTGTRDRIPEEFRSFLQDLRNPAKHR